MITACIIYNYNSYFQMSLSEDTTFRTLFRSLPTVLKRQKADLLYLLFEGQIIGTDPAMLNKSLDMCGLTEHRCTIHLIFKIPEDKYRYTHNDLLASHNALHYPVTAGGNVSNTPHQATVLLQDLIRQMYDVTVHLTEDQVNQYTQLVQPDGAACPICRGNMTEDILGLTTCGHRFHRECIMEWLTEFSVLCPMCNHDVREITN